MKYFLPTRFTTVGNIGKRILKVLEDKKLKPTPFEEKLNISRGYLKRAADGGHDIGSEIVEKILLQFPDVDSYWLITGHQPSPVPEKKETSILDELRKDLHIFRELAWSQQKTIEVLSSKVR